MLVTLTHLVDVQSVQKATSLREKITGLLAQDQDTTVVNATQAKLLDRYRVVGVDTSGGQPFIVEVDAEDSERAKAQVVGKSRTKVVAEVRKASR